MSDTPQVTETPRSSANPLVIGLIVAVVVLAAGIGYMVYNNSQSTTVPAPAATGTTAPAGGAATGAGTAPQPVAAFDPATATKVPAEMTPEDFVKAYHEDVAAGKFAEAYKMLPLDKQQSYGDASSYEAQVKAYGITGYEMGKPVENGDEMSIAATQITPQMPITYTWTFAKVDDTWYVKSRAMGGSTQ